MNIIPCKKCNKTITKVFNCLKCDSKLCSNNCMIDHTFEFHQQPNDNKEKVSFKRRSTMKSPFMKFGEYLRDIRDNSLYDFKNFEFVKVGKKPQVLGCGAFGDVYLAKNKVDNKYYAIKQMNKNKITEHGAKLDIVVREINVHRRLVHENIVRMYSSYEDRESFFIIMDYANSGTLFNLIKKKNGMDEKTAFKYFIQTAAAVHFLHENNLVHRDLKPENLLIDENENVKLCDFGWCVELAVGNRSTFCGTYEYMAPEIINESPYNSGIDVWSLGVLLYELIHGYSPFRAKINKNSEQEYIEIFKNIVKYNFKIEKAVSDSCGDLIKKLLSPEIKTRIKVRDIFFHPWVLTFENEFKEQKLKQALAAEAKNKKDLPVNNNVKVDNSKSSDPYRSCEIVDDSTKGSSKNSIKIEPEKPKENNMNVSKEKIVKESINQQKASQVDQLINNKQNDFSLLESNKDSLFDKVLNQVQEKNKSKKKRQRNEDNLLKDYSSILNDSQNKNNISNKIVLVAERPEIKKKEEESIIKKKDDVKKKEEQKLDHNNFSILNEISDFENKISEIEKNNKKFNEVKKISTKNTEESIDKVPVIVIPKKSNQPQSQNALKQSPYKKGYEDYNEFNLLDKEKPKEREKKNYNDEEYNNNKKLNIKNLDKIANDSETYKKNLLGGEKSARENEREKKDMKKKKNLLDDEENDFYLVEEKFMEDMKKNNKNIGSSNSATKPVNKDLNISANQKSGFLQDKENKTRGEPIDKNNQTRNNNNTKPKSLLDKGKKVNNHFEVNPDRQKNVDKEYFKIEYRLDLSFLPKELLYNERSYCESKNNLLAAIEILEKAQENKNQVQKQDKPQESKSFWSFINPFKCGNNN